MALDSTIQTTLSDDQRAMLNAMNEHNRDRQKGWTIYCVKDMPSLTDLNQAVIVGSFAYTCQALKTKWYYKPLCLLTDGGWTTPGDIARDYVALKYPERRIKCTSSQWNACVNNKGIPPLYCKPGSLENGIYLDLRSAYWQIVRSVTWAVDYNPHRYIGTNGDMLDFPYSNEKLARNCLVSIGLSGSMSLWTGTDMVYQKKPNRFINLILWRLVQDVLNAVACDMIEIGAVYVYSDGYILPADVEGLAFEILAEWGLEGRIKKHGAVDVRAPNSYAFYNEQDGLYQTKPYQSFRHTSAIVKVYDPGRAWLRKHFSVLARQAAQDWLFLERNRE